MGELFLERTFDPPLSEDHLRAGALQAKNCFNLHNVDWQESHLASDGQRLLCHFNAPDAESARVALRQVDADVSRLWSGTVHEAPEPPEGDANVLVERSWKEPVAIEDIQAIEDAGAWCMETHKVKFVRTFFSLDRKRMLCLYQAPDAESVRLAQRQAEMPVDRVWAFRLVRPRP